MEIMVLGVETTKAMREAVTKKALDITVTQVFPEQVEGILGKGGEQAILINGEGKIVGRVPSSQEITDLLNELSWHQNAGVPPRSFPHRRGGGFCCGGCCG